MLFRLNPFVHLQGRSVAAGEVQSHCGEGSSILTLRRIDPATSFLNGNGNMEVALLSTSSCEAQSQSLEDLT
eukprot:Gb_16430 [translate_table: standard]